MEKQQTDSDNGFVKQGMGYVYEEARRGEKWIYLADFMFQQPIGDVIGK